MIKRILNPSVWDPKLSNTNTKNIFLLPNNVPARYFIKSQKRDSQRGYFMTEVFYFPFFDHFFVTGVFHSVTKIGPLGASSLFGKSASFGGLFIKIEL